MLSRIFQLTIRRYGFHCYLLSVVMTGCFGPVCPLGGCLEEGLADPSATPKLITISPNVGSRHGRTLITVRGSSFGAGATVSLANQACDNVTVISGERLTCETPAHLPGLVDITVQNAQSDPTSFAEAFTYRAYVYVANGNPATISAFAMNPSTGALETISGSPFSVGATPRGLKGSIDGKYLYVSYSNSITQFSIDSATGGLTALSPTFSTVTNPTMGISTEQSGKYLYVAGVGGLKSYAINGENGALAELNTGSTASDPLQIVVDPTTQWLYVAAGGIQAFSITPNGFVGAEISGSPFISSVIFHGLAIDAARRFIFGTRPASAEVYVRHLNETTGALENDPGSPYSTESSPRGVALDPGGKFLYVANQGSNSISAYSVSSFNGALTPVGSPVSTGSGPFAIAVDPSGSFVCVTNGDAGTTGVYAIGSTGTLTQISGSPFSTGSLSSQIVVP